MERVVIALIATFFITSIVFDVFGTEHARPETKTSILLDRTFITYEVKK